MVINILANTSIMLLAIYIYFKLNNSTTQYYGQTLHQHLFYIGCVSIVGILLMSQAIVLSGVRFDFRGLLFALSIRYLGWRTTLPSILLLMGARFFWGPTYVSMLNVLLSAYYIVSLPVINHYIKGRYSVFTQLLILLTNTLAALAVISSSQLSGYVEAFQIIVFFWAINYFLLFLCYLIIDDLSSMVSKINQDCLTSLNNQRRFQEDLKIMNEIDDKITIGILDIDHFKAYNDRFGHEVGDLVLQKVSNILLLHTSNLVNGYRVGGEEFAIVIVGHSRRAAEQMIEKLHQDIMDVAIEGVVDSVIRPTVSIGVAHIQTNETAKEAYRRADIALYHSKNNGRNQVQVSINGSNPVQISSKANQEVDLRIL